MYRLTVAFFLLGQMLSADLSSVLAHQESEVALAISGKNKTLLGRLIDDDFHESITYGSAFHNVTTDVGRNSWIALMTAGDVVKCEVSTVHSRSAGHGSFFVTIRGTLTLRSADGVHHGKRFESLDTWGWRSDGWRLGSRATQAL